MGKSIHRWSDEEKEYLKEITPGRHHKEITDLMNEKFEYKFEVKQIKNAIKRYGYNTGFNGQFKKGHKTWNKGTKEKFYLELKDLQVQIKLLLKKVMSHEIKRKLVVKELILMDIS